MSAALDVDARLRLGGFGWKRFTAPGDGITVLFGPSGGGKTRLAVAPRGPSASTAAIPGGRCDDRLMSRRTSAASAWFQDAAVPHLTARRNIHYAWRRADAAKRLDGRVSRFFDITALLDRPVRNLSGGEKSRVAGAPWSRRRISCCWTNPSPRWMVCAAASSGAARKCTASIVCRCGGNMTWTMAALGSHLVALRDGYVVASVLAQAASDTAFMGLLDPRDSGAAISAALHSGHDDTAVPMARADHVLLVAAPPRGNLGAQCSKAKLPRSRRRRQHTWSRWTAAGTVLSRVTEGRWRN